MVSSIPINTNTQKSVDRPAHLVIEDVKLFIVGRKSALNFYNDYIYIFIYIYIYI